VTGSDGEWAAYLFEPKYGTLERFASFAGLFRGSRQLMEYLEERRTADE
jgi:hypothetical protein